jgi:diguanylate cyclase (GGDEF)-like protein
MKTANSREPLSETVEWKLVEELFHQRSIIVVSLVCMPAVAAMSFSRTGQTWFVVWGVAAIGLALLRLAVEFAFTHRRERFKNRRRWQLLFLAGSSLNGLLSGILAAGVGGGPDPFTQMLGITMMTAFVMGSAARNAVYPAAAISFVLLAEGPLLVACLLSRNAYYMLYAVFIVMYAFTSVSVVGHFYARTVRFLCADEEEIELMNQIRRSNDELAGANRQLAAMARIDGLTGVANRRRFDELLERETHRARSGGSPFSLLMLDIDAFKGYNDRYGHQAGDDCLRIVARTVAACLRRPGDIVARYGGEEFVAILPSTDEAGAVALAETIRSAIEALRVESVDAPGGVVTLSVGVATSNDDAGWNADELIRRADAALYEAKRAGRNCVWVAEPGEAPSRLALGPAEEVALP